MTSPPVSGLAAPAVALDSVRKTFGSVVAVDDVTLTIDPGEIVALLGPNGAGKTSTIDMVLGLSRPTAGRLSVFGMPPHDAMSHGLVSAVMQTGGLLKDYTVRETVEVTASLFPDLAPRRGGARASGHRVDRRPDGRQVLRR